MTPETINNCLLGHQGDAILNEKLRNDYKCVLESGTCPCPLDNTSTSGSITPDLVVVLKLLAQSMSSETAHERLQNTLSNEMVRIEQEAYSMLNDIFEGHVASANDDCNSNYNDKGGHDDEGDLHKQQRKRVKQNGVLNYQQQSPLANDVTGVNGDSYKNDNSLIDFATDDDDVLDDENASSQYSNDSSGHYHRNPLPLPLSQYSFQEKRNYYKLMDTHIDSKMSLMSQNYAAVIGVLPIYTEFTTAAETKK
jgi:hypothetical protein